MPAMHVALNFNTYYKTGDRNKIWNRHIKPLFTSMHTEYKRERERDSIEGTRKRKETLRPRGSIKDQK